MLLTRIHISERKAVENSGDFIKMNQIEIRRQLDAQRRLIKRKHRLQNTRATASNA